MEHPAPLLQNINITRSSKRSCFKFQKPKKYPPKPSSCSSSLLCSALHLQIQASMLSSRTIRSPEKPESKFEDEEEAEELERLETEVKQIAKKILEYRATLPDQLKTTVASLPSSQRPISPDCDSGTDPGPPGELNPDSGQDKSSRAAFLTKEDQETAEKAHLLIEEISSNVSTMPVVLKRMRDCISRINKLDSYIHPAFKKKKTG